MRESLPWGSRGTAYQTIVVPAQPSSSLRTQGPQRERNCAHRGGADSRIGTGAEAFSFTCEAGVYGSLRSQGRQLPYFASALVSSIPNPRRPCERRDPSVSAIALIAAARTLVRLWSRGLCFT